MARLLTQVLGTMSGSVGDIVFRRRGGRSYVSAHPSGYTPRTDAATVARKKQLKTAVEIAKNINSIPLLKADRKSTRLNSSHLVISYADFCVKKIRIPYDNLKSELFRILISIGFSESKSEKCAEIFTMNSADVFNSHGTNRFPRFVKNIVEGYVKPDADPSLLHNIGSLE